jgi:two-component sensor histidine kinase
LVGHLADTHGDDWLRAPVRAAIEDANLGVETAVPLGLVANELISNAYKHAFPDGRRGEVLLQFRLLDERRAELVVADDGVGLPAGFDPGQLRSLGMRLVTSLTEQLGGELSHGANGDAGTRFALRFTVETPELERLSS